MNTNDPAVGVHLRKQPPTREELVEILRDEAWWAGADGDDAGSRIETSLNRIADRLEGK